MRVGRYLAAPMEMIYKALEHTMRCVYIYWHLPMFYPHRPLGKKALAMHWAKGYVEYLSAEYDTVLVNSADEITHATSGIVVLFPPVSIY
jgi:hypothetical protein